MIFHKFEAAGNDFIIIDARKNKAEWNRLAINMCHRHFGVGADGIILVDAREGNNLYMRIFNADGSEAEVCGNGLRCFAKYVSDEGIDSSDELQIFTPSGVKLARVYKENGKVERVRVNMGLPRFGVSEIPLDTGFTNWNEFYIKDMLYYPLKVGRAILDLNFISMGNPHAVAFISKTVDEYDLGDIGPRIENNELFPRKTNFEIANVIDRKTIKARVWERGVGETLACGSGACAIGVAAIQREIAENNVDIIMPGGKLEISWEPGGDVYLTGSVKKVFTGDWLKANHKLKKRKK